MATYEIFNALNVNDVINMDGEQLTVISKDDFKKSIELVMKSGNDYFSLFLNKQDRTITHEDGHYWH
jgi:hypothetical protein